MKMNVIAPKPPFLPVKQLVVSMGGRMCYSFKRMAWVILIAGHIGIFPMNEESEFTDLAVFTLKMVTSATTQMKS